MNIEHIVDYVSKRRDVAEWAVESSREVSREAFYTGNRLDMARSKDVQRMKLTIHADGTLPDGKEGRGTAVLSIPASADESELANLIDQGLSRALVSLGPGWKLPKGISAIAKAVEDGDFSPRDAIQQAREAIFASVEAGEKSEGSENDPKTRFSAVELFATTRGRRFIASNGAEASWQDAVLEVELATLAGGQGGEEAELVESWVVDPSGDTVETPWSVQLGTTARNLLKRTSDRALAKPMESPGDVPIILTGDAVPEFFRHFFYRVNSAQVRAGSSDAAIGKPIVSGVIGGDPLTMGFDPQLPGSPENRPMDDEGTPLHKTVLVEGGIVRGMEGPARHAAALGIQSVGSCASHWVAPGSVSQEEIAAMPRLECLVFSDFFMDEISGEFCGELRLGILHNGDERSPFTGGSISGSISAEQANFRFSTNVERRGAFLGPDSVILSSARIAKAN